MDFNDKMKYMLSACIPKPDYDTDEQLNKCLANFYSLKSFTDEEDLMNLEYITYKAIKYFADVEGVLTKEMFFGYLVSTIDTFMKSNNVKINDILVGDTHNYNLELEGDYDVAKRELMALLSEYYDELVQIDTSKHEFKSMLKLYAEEMFNYNYKSLLQKQAIIATRGLDIWLNGKLTRLFGPKDAHDFYVSQYTLLESKYNFQDEDYFDTSGDVSQIYEADKEQETLYDIISDTGIKPIDDALKGFRRTQLLGVEAGAGVGKTRFSRWIAYRAVTMFKKDVFDVTMEQQKTEIWALYVSTHLWVKYKTYIPDSDLKRNTYPKELAHIVEVAKLDLFTNKEYGRLRIVAKDMYIEEAFEYLTGVYNTVFKYDMLLLDYASLVDSRARKKYGASDSYEIVTTVYRRTKRDICRKLKVFALVINQLKESGVKALAKGEMTTTYDASNSGETYKSTDANLVLSSNQSLDREGKIRITSPKFRDAEKFYSVYATAKMGCSFFTYDDTEEITEDEYNQTLQDVS